MVWIKFKEKFHGKKYVFWKKKKSVSEAREEAKSWNRFDNPMEHLSVVKSTQERPKGLRKTKHRGIYKRR